MKGYLNKGLFAMLIACICFMVPKGAQGQVISNPPLTVDQTCWTDFTSTGSSVYVAPTYTVTNGTPDTVHIKVKGGTAQNKLHIWTVATKLTGSTDSNTVTIWASSERDCGTNYKVLYTDQTANSAGAQVFEHVIDNVWTNYMIISKRISVLSTAQTSSYTHSILLR